MATKLALLLAKISKKFASMFVWRFVCLFVCLFVTRYRSQFSANHHQTWFTSQNCIVFIGQRSNNWVTKSKSRSIIEIAITPLIFELKRRSRAQNVGNGMAYIDMGLHFPYNIRFKRSPGPQNGGHFENFAIFQIGPFRHQIWKDRQKLSRKRPF